MEATRGIRLMGTSTWENPWEEGSRGKIHVKSVEKLRENSRRGERLGASVGWWFFKYCRSAVFLLSNYTLDVFK